MTSRQRLLSALDCQPVDRPPIWVMRQAGRYLPEYRALKEQHGFLKMVRTPGLAAEVTLQPLQRFALDAAILFSDILIIPEALGFPYYFKDEGGIGMERLVSNAQDIASMEPDAVAERLDFVAGGLRETRRGLGEDKALLGFAGSPWTLAIYLVDGGTKSDGQSLKHLAWTQPSLFAQLMEKLAQAVAALLRLKLEAGADAVQIFDSWAALCPGRQYRKLSLQWIEYIIDELPDDARVIVFAKGMAPYADTIAERGASAIGLDWTADLAAVHQTLAGQAAVQGNLDPALLSSTPEAVREAAEDLLEAMRGKSGWVANLGHGIKPDAKIECMEALVDAVVRSE